MKTKETKLVLPRPIQHKFYRGILGCVTTDDHHPEENTPFWLAKLSWIAHNQPDRIEINGDFLEMNSVSMHGKKPVADFISLEQDLDVGRRVLRKLRALAPNAEITYLEGNHETRLTRYIAEHVPGPTQGSIGTLPEELHLDKLGIRWVPENEQPITIGTLDLLHGHQVPGKMLPIYHAKKIAELYGRPGHIVAIGHSHRSQRFDRPSKFGNAVGIALGCGRTLDPHWMKGSPGGWSAEWMIYNVIDGITDAHQVQFKNGRMVWGGQVYGAGQ